MTAPKDAGDGEIEFSESELLEMNVEVAGREPDAASKRRRRSMLRVPADEVPHPQDVAVALLTERSLDAMPASVDERADALVDHAFSNGGVAEGEVPATLGLAAQPLRDETEPVTLSSDEYQTELEDDSPTVITPIPEPAVPEAKKPPRLSPALKALVRAVATAPSGAAAESASPPMVAAPAAEAEVVPVRPPPMPAPPPAIPTRPPEKAIEAPVADRVEAEAAAAPAVPRPAEGDVELEDEELEEVESSRAASGAAPPAEPERARSLTPVMLTPPSPPPPPQAQALAPPIGSQAPGTVAPPLPQSGPPRPPAVASVAPAAAPALSAASAEAPLRPRRRRRAKQWFEEIFDDDYLRTLPFLTPRQTEREAAFVAESMGVEPGAALLDLGCGYGRHAMELATRGCKVTGLDLSLPLLIRAADAARRVGVNVNFVHGDMREMTFENEFDGAYSMFTSFGYFDDDTNRKVAANLARAIRPGGKLLLDVVNRDYLVRDLPTRVWWQGEGCVVLEEVDFNYFSSRLQVQRSIIFEDGRQAEQDISIRAYSLHEIGKVLHHSGFRVTEVSGGLGLRGKFFGAESRQLIVLAEKKAIP